METAQRYYVARGCSPIECAPRPFILAEVAERTRREWARRPSHGEVARLEDVDELGSSLLTDPESVALGSFVLRMRLGVVSSPLLTARYERLEMDNRLCVLCMGALCEVGHRDPPEAPHPPGWQEGVEDRPRARLALQHILLYCPAVSAEREMGLQFMDHVASHLKLPQSTMPRMALLPERQSACGVPYLEATSQVLCRLLRVTKVVIVTVNGKVMTAPPEFQRHLGVVESQGSDGGGASAASASDSAVIERVLALVAEPMRGSKTKVRLPRGTVAIVARSKSLSRLPQYGLKLVTVPPGHSLLMMHKSESPRLQRDEVDVPSSTMSELGPMSPYRVSVVIRGSVSASVHKMSAWRLVSEMARSRVEDVAMAMCQALNVDVAGGFGVCHLLRLQHEHQLRALRELPSEMSEENRQLLRESTPNLMRGVVTSAMAGLASGPTGSAKSLWLRSLSRVSVVCAMRVHATYSSRHAQQSSVHVGRHVGRRDADEGEDGGEEEEVVEHQQVAAGEHDDDEAVMACEDVDEEEEVESSAVSARSKRKSREEGEEKVDEVVMSPWQLAKRGALESSEEEEEKGSERVSRAVSVAGRVMRSSGSRDVELCTMCGDGLVSRHRKGCCNACYQRTYQHARWLKMAEVVRKVESESGSGKRVSLVSIVAEGVKQGVKNSEEEWLRCAYQVVKGVVVNRQREVMSRPRMRKNASRMLMSMSEKEKEMLGRK